MAWTEMPLGEAVLVNPRERLPKGTVTPYLGMAEVPEQGVTVSATVTRPFSSGTKFRAGDTLMARITPCLENGKTARLEGLDPEVIAHGSTEFIVLRARPGRTLPEFVTLLAQNSSVQNHAIKHMVGTSGRQRVSARDAAACPVMLPPLEVQRRIVDLIAHIDRAAVDAAQVHSAARVALDAVRGDLLPAGDTVLGDVASVRSGPSWSAADEHRQATPDSLPVLKITNTRPDGTIELDEIVHVDGLSDSTMTLGEDSLVLIRTNGNRDRIGNVYLPPKDAHGFAVSAFQMVIDVDPAYGRQLLFHFLASPATQRQLSDAASGTTGLGNLAVKWLRKLRIPDEAARSHVPVLAHAQVAAARAAEVLHHLQTTRKSLLDDLLAGERVIPDSYDRFLDGVAA